jgi:hypothetical protein
MLSLRRLHLPCFCDVWSLSSRSLRMRGTYGWEDTVSINVRTRQVRTITSSLSFRASGPWSMLWQLMSCWRMTAAACRSRSQPLPNPRPQHQQIYTHQLGSLGLRRISVEYGWWHTVERGLMHACWLCHKREISHHILCHAMPERGGKEAKAVTQRNHLDVFLGQHLSLSLASTKAAEDKSEKRYEETWRNK